MKPIYLDYNATTPIDPHVFDVMRPYMEEHFGNPSSDHVYGEPVREALRVAREQVAQLLGCEGQEVVFTSGGSESDNHALIGGALANMTRGKHIITSCIEHPAVLNTCRYLEYRLGFDVTYLSVDEYGLVNPEDVRKAITEDTILITIMHANNEIGTIEPINEIGEIARKEGVLLHTDAAQSCGKIPVDVNSLEVDLLSLVGHKIYAPKGIGALFVRRGTQMDSLIHGAGQECGRRAGTENIPYIVGLGKACQIAGNILQSRMKEVMDLRDQLYARLLEGLGKDRVSLNGHPEKRLPNTLNISISDIVGEELLAQIPMIAASTGSACHSGSTEPSQVLLKMGLTQEEALGALRLSLGRWTNKREIYKASDLIVEQVKHTIYLDNS